MKTARLFTVMLAVPLLVRHAADSAAFGGDETLHAHCDSNPTVHESPNVTWTLQVETRPVGSDSPRRHFFLRRRSENGNPSNLSG